MARRILLIDDDKHQIDLMVKALKMKGFDARAVYNGQDALALLFNKDKFDAVVIDVRMPGMDGKEVLRKMPNGYPPVVVSTGDTNADVKEFLGMKVYRVLNKPYDVDLLVKALDEIAPEQPCPPQPA
jgi:DNA-binding NtrC family response regulator